MVKMKSESTGQNIKQTYLALRFAMVLLVAMLFGSIIVQYFAYSPDCFQHSISAYYFTAARGVFVGSLCAIGVCLIIHRGSTDAENVLLDYSGFMALVVAFVPTTIDRTCAVSNAPSDDELAEAVQNNVLALFGIAIIAVILGVFVKKVRQDPNGPLTAFAKWALGVTLLLLFAGFWIFLMWRYEFQQEAHDWSARLLFVGIFGVVVVNAIELGKEGSGPKKWVNKYSVLAGLMVVAAGGCLVAKAALDFGHWLTLLEALLIAGFGVFWMIQTNELGGKVSRKDEGTPEDRAAV
ncbi:MAG TPA: hypothetical protein VM677_08985 [Actinokineospora sp.]|jgi:hypothetical protein|nr:hypothetical protein [Actinokineospora sp.]